MLVSNRRTTKVATEKQIAANRLNAQKCTGPRTPEGKAISSQNALKTGIDANSEILRCEDREQHDTLVAEFYKRYHPTEPEERSLVDMLIRSEWLTRRYATIEAGVWEQGFKEIGNVALGKVFNRSDESFNRVDRRINSAQRNYQKALKQLTEMQDRRAKEPPQAVPEPEQTTTPQPENPVAAEPLTPEMVLTLIELPSVPIPIVLDVNAPVQPIEKAPEKENLPPIAA
jgi:hypothetical protein